MNEAAWQFFLLVLLSAPDWSETGIEDDISAVTNCLPPDYMFKIRKRTNEPVFCRVEEVLQKYVKNAKSSVCLVEIKTCLNYTLKPVNSAFVRKCNGSSNGDCMEDMTFVNLTEFRCLVLRAVDELTEPGDGRVDPNDACFTRDETWYQCDAKSMTPTQTNSTGSKLSTTQPKMSTTQIETSTAETMSNVINNTTFSTTQQIMSTTQTTSPQPARISEQRYPTQEREKEICLCEVSRQSAWESSQWFVVVILLISANVLFISLWARHRKLLMSAEITWQLITVHS